MDYLIIHDKYTAKQFTSTLRKHDDYLFFNNFNILPYLKKQGSWPRLMLEYFELKSTSKDIEESNYLDTNIHIINNPYKNKPDIQSNLINKTLIELKLITQNLKLKTTENKKTILERILQHKKPYNNLGLITCAYIDILFYRNAESL